MDAKAATADTCPIPAGSTVTRRALVLGILALGIGALERGLGGGRDLVADDRLEGLDVACPEASGRGPVAPRIRLELVSQAIGEAVDRRPRRYANCANRCALCAISRPHRSRGARRR